MTAKIQIKKSSIFTIWSQITVLPPTHRQPCTLIGILIYMVLVVTKINNIFCGGLCCYVGTCTSYLISLPETDITGGQPGQNISQISEIISQFYFEISYTPVDC